MLARQASCRTTDKPGACVGRPLQSWSTAGSPPNHQLRVAQHRCCPDKCGGNGPKTTAANRVGRTEIDCSVVFGKSNALRSATAAAMASTTTMRAASSRYPASIKLRQLLCGNWSESDIDVSISAAMADARGWNCLHHPSNGVYDAAAVSSQSRSHAYAEGHESLVVPSHPRFSTGGGHPSFGGSNGGTARWRTGCWRL